MRILYFSWLKEKIGLNSQEIIKPENVETVGDLITFLKEKSENHKNAFSDLNSIKVAVNQEFADLEKKIKEKDEIAFFPPVTGG